jgi:hypothetical protein
MPATNRGPVAGDGAPDPAAPERTITVNLREDPLRMLQRQSRVAHLVGPAEIEAGMRFRADLGLAGTIPAITMDWTRPAVDGSSGEGMSVSDRVVAARLRVDRALKAVGPDFSGILIDICGFGKGVEILEREQALPHAGSTAVPGPRPAGRLRGDSESARVGPAGSPGRVRVRD